MLAASMSRRAGGIAPAIRALSSSLAAQSVDLEVFAARDEYSSSDLRDWGDIPVNLHKVQGPASFGWQPDLKYSLRRKELDVLHQHGLWMYYSVAATGWSKREGPRVISPHGMLDPWALKNSWAKKRISQIAFERRNLAGAACLHALCDAERDAIRACGIEVPIAVIPNGVDLSEAEGPFLEPNWNERIPKGAKVLLYLGRIHPKKGLDTLLEALSRLQSSDAERWHLVVAGWGQEGYEAKLGSRATALELDHRVHFVGPQFGADKKASFARADAFILPSFSEGLPMAVLEAWSFGLPVLMTEACNLPEGFAAGAAFEITTDPAKMASVLDQVLAMSEDDLAQAGRAGRKLVEEKFTWSTVAEQMAAVYRWVLGDGERPDHVRIG